MRHLICPACKGLNRAPEGRADPRCGRCSEPLSTHPVDVDDATLARLVRSSPVPVLVDFWAPWCGPCRMVAPQVAELAAELNGQALVVKVNTDEHQLTMGQLGFRGIPTFAVYNGGQLVQQQSGAMGKTQLRAMIPG